MSKANGLQSFPVSQSTLTAEEAEDVEAEVSVGNGDG